MSGDDLNEQYQTEVDAVDEEITFTNETLADLGAKQYISTKANFKGRVSIPEVKMPILDFTVNFRRSLFSWKSEWKGLD